jgi:SAM-dependent methyltransferase
VQPPSPTIPQHFDKTKLRRCREKLFTATGRSGAWRDGLYSFMAQELIYRLSIFKRTFQTIGLIGYDFSGKLPAYWGPQATCVCVDSSLPPAPPNGPVYSLSCDETLPFGAGTFDCIISLGHAHYVNDVPGFLRQCLYALKPDGLMLGVMAGENTFNQLGQTLAQVDDAYLGGMGMRLPPLVRVKDMGMLMQRAGFALCSSDRETLDLPFKNYIHLMRTLTNLGQTYSAFAPSPPPPLTAAMHRRASAYYEAMFPSAGGGIHAQLDLIYFGGWAPASNQQQPLPRGSAQHSLERALA